MNTIDRFEEIRDEINDLAHEALRLVRDDVGWDCATYERARGYWYAHIISALNRDNEFLGGSFITMQDTIDDLDEATSRNEINHE